MGVEITYEIAVEQDDTPVRGNAIASGDAVADKEVEDEILRRLDQGDVWAWACVEVRAIVELDGQRFLGNTYLGGVSCKDEAEFRENDDYFSDMKAEALLDLENCLTNEVNRGKVAASLLAEIAKL